MQGKMGAGRVRAGRVSVRTSAYRGTTALSLCMLCALSVSARAGGILPTGGQYVAGQGSIAGSGNGLTVMQSSSRGIVNWQSFSIGSGNSVFFNNGQGATLNRVTGGNLSKIDGSLSATGSVYLGYNTATGTIEVATVTGGDQTDSSAVGTVAGAGNVGGFAGLNAGTLSTAEVIQTNVDAPAAYQVGGFVGSNIGDGFISSDIVLASNVVGFSQVGGFAGSNSAYIAQSAASLSVADGTDPAVSGVNQVGGFAGVNTAAGTIVNSSSEIVGAGPVTGTGNQIGGFAGSNAGSLTGDESSDDVTGVNFVGGFVGTNSGSVGTSFATGTVGASGYDAGGLVGYNTLIGSIDQSYAVGSVTALGSAGGLVGLNIGSITDSYATGSVGAGSSGNAGGLVGINEGSIATSYATGSESGPKRLGGLVGSNIGGTITNGYWDTQASGQAKAFGFDNNNQSGNVQGLTTLDLQSGLPANFDPTVWGSDPTINDGYPYLLSLSSSY